MIKKDLTPVLHIIEHSLKQFYESENRPVMVCSFIDPRDSKTVHWITNVTRENGILVMESTINAMKEQGESEKK